MSPALAALAALAAAASDPQGLTLSVDPAASTVHFHVKHKMHSVDGRSGAVEGKAVIAPDGKVLAMVRIPVASFDSGDANRDANMRETLEVGRYPHVVFKGVASGVATVAHGKPFESTLRGELTFHGVTRPVEVPVSIEFASDDSATVRGKLLLSLESFKVERPSLLFIKVDDALAVDVDLTLRRTGP